MICRNPAAMHTSSFQRRARCENSHHFLFDCDKYTDNREILFNSLNWLPSNINIDVNLLTKGSDLLNKGNNKITELRTILQRESQNS
jgi:hypothetical protein